MITLNEKTAPAFDLLEGLDSEETLEALRHPRAFRSARPWPPPPFEGKAKTKSLEKLRKAASM